MCSHWWERQTMTTLRYIPTFPAGIWKYLHNLCISTVHLSERTLVNVPLCGPTSLIFVPNKEIKCLSIKLIGKVWKALHLLTGPLIYLLHFHTDKASKRQKNNLLFLVTNYLLLYSFGSFFISYHVVCEKVTKRPEHLVNRVSR